ncbi:MAG: hypothetical protein ACFFC7_12200 [Candidatus Hermodarchaeota archaeon]
MAEPLQKQYEHKISSHLYQWSSSDVITVAIMAVIVIAFSLISLQELGNYGIFALILWIGLTVAFLIITFFIRPFYLNRLRATLNNPAHMKYMIFSRYADGIYSDFFHSTLNRLGIVGIAVMWGIVIVVPLYEFLSTQPTSIGSVAEFKLVQYGLLALLALYVTLNVFLLDSLLRNRWIRAKHYLEHLVFSNKELKTRQLQLIEEALEISPDNKELQRAKERVSKSDYRAAYNGDCPFCWSQNLPEGETLLEYIMGRTHEPDMARNLISPVEIGMKDLNSYYTEILGLDTDVFEKTSATIFMFALEAEQDSQLIAEVRTELLQVIEHLDNIEPIRAMLDLKDIPDYYKGTNLTLMPTLEQKTISFIWSQRLKVISLITTIIMSWVTGIIQNILQFLKEFVQFATA